MDEILLTSQEQNHVSRLQDWAESFIKVLQDGQRLKAEHALNHFDETITTEKLISIKSFGHISQEKVANLLQTITLLNELAGDYENGKLGSVIQFRG